MAEIFELCVNFSNKSQFLEKFSLDTIFEIIFILPIIALIIFGNAFVLFLFACDKKLQKNRYWFMVSLAVADLFIGILVMPFTLIYKVFQFWPFGVTLCQIWLATDVWLCTTSTLTICAIGIDRYGKKRNFHSKIGGKNFYF